MRHDRLRRADDLHRFSERWGAPGGAFASACTTRRPPRCPSRSRGGGTRRSADRHGGLWADGDLAGLHVQPRVGVPTGIRGHAHRPGGDARGGRGGPRGAGGARGARSSSRARTSCWATGTGPEDTRLAIRGGWFHTGDIGYLDDDGYLYLVDRVKDMINSAGLKIWPREVEEVLFGIPRFANARWSAFPTPSRARSRRPWWCAIRRRPADAGRPRRVLPRAPGHLQGAAGVEFVDALPKSASGKILKRVLRQGAPPSR